jgi:hypothetical protein
MKDMRLVFLGLIIISCFLGVSCQPADSESVLLQGAVTIGPITPVEITGQTNVVPPEVFSTRKLMIYDESGKRLIREVYFTQIGQGDTGYYTAQISPGTYTIDINRAGMDRAEGLPQKISPDADETVTIDVNIDTGIR